MAAKLITDHSMWKYTAENLPGCTTVLLMKVLNAKSVNYLQLPDVVTPSINLDKSLYNH